MVAVSISSQKNAAAVASIQVPSNDYAMDLKPRTLVHVFCYDAYRGAPPEQQVVVAGQGIRTVDPEAGSIIPPEVVNSSDEQSQTDLENDNYKLIFCGEVVGIQYSKTPMSRGIVLQCLDLSSYWDIAFQYQVSGYGLGGGGIKAAFTGASTTLFNDFMEGSGDIVAKLLETEPRSYPTLKGTLLGGVINLLEAIGGVYYGKNSIRGTNDFFSLAEMRLHITQMIGANAYSAEDEARLLRANGFRSLFTKALGGLGKLVTARQVLLALQRYIFHEIVPITSPRFVPGAAPDLLDTNTVGLMEDKNTVGIARAAQDLKTAVQKLRVRQEIRETTEQSAARGDLQKEILALATAAQDASLMTRKQVVAGGDSDGFGLREVAKIFESTSRQLVRIRGLLTFLPNGTYTFPARSEGGNSTLLLQLLEEISDGMQRILQSKHRIAGKQTWKQSDPPPRLLTQIYRPDVWMVAPPRCNVLFPEMYSQFSYSRNFQAEVSRLLLRTHEAFYGSDILFDGFYMAPSRLLGSKTGKPIAAGRTGQQPDITDAPAWVIKDLMDHELYTGIIPTFERMPDLNLHAIRGGHVENNGVKISYAQLACNHIFFQYRFRSRDLSLSGKFNPYIALGFPSVVIDKYLADDQLRAGEYDSAVALRILEASTETSTTALLESDRQLIVEASVAKVQEAIGDIIAQRPNTHYLGTPDMISHSLSASSGGSTQIQMGYARTTNEKTEFLGDNVGQSAKAYKSGSTTIPTVVAALEAPRVGSLGIRGGKIVAVQDVTDSYQKKQPRIVGRSSGGAVRFSSDSLLPLYAGGPTGLRSGRVRGGTRVPVGIEQPAAAYGTEVIALVNSGGRDNAAVNQVVTFRAYKISEEVGSYLTKNVELTPENMTFPPWYSEKYRSNQVGALYADYFGVGAITDATEIHGITTAVFGSDSRKLTLDLEVDTAVARPDQMPSAGTPSTPIPSGGGTIGPSSSKVTLGTVDAQSPVGLAIEEIVKAYSATRSQHFDTPQFIQNYTWRPIASMTDLFGTAALSIDEDGNVVSGREGFHSRAFGDYDDLRQLVRGGAGAPQKILGLTPAAQELSTDKAEADAEISKRLDTRREKRLQVYRYLSALSAARGVVLG